MIGTALLVTRKSESKTAVKFGDNYFVSEPLLYALDTPKHARPILGIGYMAVVAPIRLWLLLQCARGCFNGIGWRKVPTRCMDFDYDSVWQLVPV